VIQTKDRAGADLNIAATPISGTEYPLNILTRTDGTPVNAATEESVAALTTAVNALLTNTELRATPVPVDVAGELLEALEAMRFALQALTRSMGQMLPDAASRMRVNIETGTLPAVTTVTTVATLTNQTQIGGLAATEQIPSLMRLGADSLRRNISVN